MFYRRITSIFFNTADHHDSPQGTTTGATTVVTTEATTGATTETMNVMRNGITVHTGEYPFTCRLPG